MLVACVPHSVLRRLDPVVAATVKLHTSITLEYRAGKVKYNEIRSFLNADDIGMRRVVENLTQNEFLKP